jgi:hypothetical protein
MTFENDLSDIFLNPAIAAEKLFAIAQIGIVEYGRVLNLGDQLVVMPSDNGKRAGFYVRVSDEQAWAAIEQLRERRQAEQP